jgi:hypothetical protein
MHHSSKSLILAGCSALLLAGCSSDGGLFDTDSLTTQSISTNPSTAMATKADPACYTIAQRIETLRREGVTERLEKASAGKSSTVSVKRTSLAQAAELDRANAEFQAKCSAFGPRPAQAQVAPAAGGSNSAQVVSATAPRTTATAPPVVVQQR